MQTQGYRTDPSSSLNIDALGIQNSHVITNFHEQTFRDGRVRWLKIRTLTFVGEVKEDGGGGATFFLRRALTLVDLAEVGVSLSAAVAPHGCTVVTSHRMFAAACCSLFPWGVAKRRNARRSGLVRRPWRHEMRFQPSPPPGGGLLRLPGVSLGRLRVLVQRRSRAPWSPI